jgi:NTP pyrophosphatase (non-canonical NTP hydrolase)
MQHIAKAIRDYDGTVSEDIMCKELGDILWFVACVAHHNGFDLSDIAAANLAKLADRQRRGVIGGSGDNR